MYVFLIFYIILLMQSFSNIPVFKQSVTEHNEHRKNEQSNFRCRLGVTFRQFPIISSLLFSTSFGLTEFSSFLDDVNWLDDLCANSRHLTEERRFVTSLLTLLLLPPVLSSLFELHPASIMLLLTQLRAHASFRDPSVDISWFYYVQNR